MGFFRKNGPQYSVGMHFYYIEGSYGRGLEIREDVVKSISSNEDSESISYTYYGRFNSRGISAQNMFFTRKDAEVARFNKFVDNLSDFIKTTNEKVSVELAEAKRYRGEIYELLKKAKTHVEKRTK